jgi:hypothetical protein
LLISPCNNANTPGTLNRRFILNESGLCETAESQVLEFRFISMAQEQAKEEPKGLFTSIFDGVKNAGSAVVDGAAKV